MNVASGKIHDHRLPRHRRNEFPRFIRHLERRVAKGLSIHVILDNCANHKSPEVEQWLRRHPRVHFHFTSSTASWLNLVERFCSELTTRQLRRVAVTSVDELEAAIHMYMVRRNTDPQHLRGPYPRLARSPKSRRRTKLWHRCTRSPLSHQNSPNLLDADHA